MPLGEHRGIKRINWITNQAALGGFYAAVLVKPLTSMMLREPLTMTEQSLIHHKASMPRIHDGAYINFMLQASANSTSSPGVIRGEFDFLGVAWLFLHWMTWSTNEQQPDYRPGGV